MTLFKDLLVIGLKTLKRFLDLASSTCGDVIGLIERSDVLEKGEK